jgi:hypothetical protein
MTEAEWLACEKPRAMLAGLRAGVHDRRLRLFAVGCARHILPHIRKEKTDARLLLEVAERFADGLATPSELAAAYDAHTCKDYGVGAAHMTCFRDAHGAAQSAASCAVRFAPIAWVRANPGQRQTSRGGRVAAEAEVAAQVQMLHCVFDSAIRSVVFDPAWRTSTAVSLAGGMYGSRDFGAMPILADALQDAGCDNEDVLNHCRDPNQTHVRGCWVVDRVLGKV